MSVMRTQALVCLGLGVDADGALVCLCYCVGFRVYENGVYVRSV